MTFSDILKAAHAYARDERRRAANRGESFNYREAFAEGMKSVYATQRAAPVTTGFRVVEPWYKRQMWTYQKGPAGWVTL